MKTLKNRTDGQMIFERLINSQKGDFWLYPTTIGLKLMRQAKNELILVKSSPIFSGNPSYGHTATTNLDKITCLSRHIINYERDLSSDTQDFSRIEEGLWFNDSSIDSIEKSQSEIFCEGVINSKENSFWAIHSQEAIDLMVNIKEKLIDIGPSLTFKTLSIEPSFVILNSDYIDYLNQRIARWEYNLKTQKKALI